MEWNAATRYIYGIFRKLFKSINRTFPKLLPENYILAAEKTG
jgi:hypothetical protein